MTTRAEAERDVKLLVSLVAMVFVGLGNKSARFSSLCARENWE